MVHLLQPQPLAGMHTSPLESRPEKGRHCLPFLCVAASVIFCSTHAKNLAISRPSRPQVT